MGSAAFPQGTRARRAGLCRAIRGIAFRLIEHAPAPGAPSSATMAAFNFPSMTPAPPMHRSGGKPSLLVISHTYAVDEHAKKLPELSRWFEVTCATVSREGF